MSEAINRLDPASSQPLCILIAALGGEGGGVLADWIVNCALACGLPVQSTSVPGVAQRTGSTSYYIELMRQAAPADESPVFALSPLPGRVDVVLASELLEAGRMMERGFVSPDRTTLIHATHRVLTTIEKMQMGDGRYDSDQILGAARRFALRHHPLDMENLANRHRTVISAIMFGALAGTGVLPWSRLVCEETIRQGGIGVESSLEGFAAAFQAVSGAAIHDALSRGSPDPGADAGIWAPLIATLPVEVHETAALGVVRLLDWQDPAWARSYLARLQGLVSDIQSGATAGQPEANLALAEAARRLAIWMSYEDVIRVADLKSRPERMHRIRQESATADSEVVRVVDFLKPGYEEIAAVLPRGAGERLRQWAKQTRRTAVLGNGIRLNTSGIVGHLALRGLAKLRPLRRRSLRFHEENAAIERWLTAVSKSLRTDTRLALAVASLPRLLKGYGETWARGQANYLRILETLVEPSLAPATANHADPRRSAASISEAMAAALADPDGRKLEDNLASLGHTPRPPSPKPIVWMKKPRGRDETR
jgi:indolepyruvate ferredoxin oxidoreductase, beta subunit